VASKIILHKKEHIFALILCAFVLLLAAVYWVYNALHVPKVEEIEKIYKGAIPKEWGEHLDGVTSLLPSKDDTKPIVYLTFDACGGEYDENLITYLRKEHIKATLFINSRWIDKHLDTFIELANDELFSIQNHGTLHRPLSVNGREAYKIKGTDSVRSVYEEIMDNHHRVKSITGRSMRYFRSGTAFYDEVAISIAKTLGYEIGGFDVLGDGGATFSKEKIISQIHSVRNGSIVIFHFNKPKSKTLAGIMAIIPKLREKGYDFGKLE